jgi:hypothetical protein
MARHKPSPLSPAEQDADHTARIARDAKAADDRRAVALEAAGGEAARVAKVQAELGIARFDDPLFELRRSFLAGVVRLEAETDIITTQRWLDTATSKGRADEERHRDRLKTLKAELGQDAEPPPLKPGEQPPEIARALEVLADDDALKAVPPKPETRLAELADKKVILEAGLRCVAGQIEERRGTRGYEQAVKLRKRHGELLIALFRAGQQFSQAAEQERLLRTAFTAAGYSPRWDVLPAPGVLGAVLVLGNEADWESQLSQYRRFLQSRKLLP